MHILRQKIHTKNHDKKVSIKYVLYRLDGQLFLKYHEKQTEKRR